MEKNSEKNSTQLIVFSYQTPTIIFMEPQGDLSSKYPALYALSQVPFNFVKERRSQVRFTQEADLELKEAIKSFNNDPQKKRQFYAAIRNEWGNSFEKKCRDRVNTYLFSKPFTPEEDAMILEFYAHGYTSEQISKMLNRKYSKPVQNRIIQLRNRATQVGIPAPVHGNESLELKENPIDISLDLFPNFDDQ